MCALWSSSCWEVNVVEQFEQHSQNSQREDRNTCGYTNVFLVFEHRARWKTCLDQSRTAQLERDNSTERLSEVKTRPWAYSRLLVVAFMFLFIMKR